MTNSKKIFIVALLVQICCKGKDSYTAESDLRQEIGSNIRSDIDDFNKSRKANYSREIVLDTVYQKELDVDRYRMIFAQYHTVDAKLSVAIIGIQNFPADKMPTYSFVDTQFRKYRIDSATVDSNKLNIYLRSDNGKGIEADILRFDLGFDGSQFPWAFDYR